MPRSPVRSLVLALGVCAGLGLYVWLNGVLVWPFLSRSRGDFGYQYPAAKALLDSASPFGAPWYDYPPLAPVLLAPLALLPFEQARVTWFLLGQACLLGAALLLVRPLGRAVHEQTPVPGARAAALAVGLVWLCAGTLQENLALGQWNPVLLLLLALAWRLEAANPGRAAAVLGVAAGIKIWPGLLLAASLLQQRWRAFAQGLAATAAALILPGLTIALTVPPPHLPVHGHFWMGSPAPLNLSLPAAVLRATYLDEEPGPTGIPHDWEIGDNTELLDLTPSRRTLSVAVSLAVLAAGLGVLVWKTGWPRRPRCTTDGLPLLAALVALALLAAPLAWYHYQLLQLPGIAWLATERLRETAEAGPRKKAQVGNRLRGVLPLLGLVGLLGLLTGLTRPYIWAPLARRLGAGEITALQAPGWGVPALGIVLFALLVREIGRGGRR
jgi:Glycosyltransferase family 87